MLLWLLKRFDHSFKKLLFIGSDSYLYPQMTDDDVYIIH